MLVKIVGANIIRCAEKALVAFKKSPNLFAQVRRVNMLDVQDSWEAEKH